MDLDMENIDFSVPLEVVVLIKDQVPNVQGQLVNVFTENKVRIDWKDIQFVQEITDRRNQFIYPNHISKKCQFVTYNGFIFDVLQRYEDMSEAFNRYKVWVRHNALKVGLQ